MTKTWLVAQAGLALLVVSWVATSGGCGAKSGLRFEETEGEVVDPDPIVRVDCETDADCDDGTFCNGQELCVDGYCEEGELVECDEGDECHMFYCDEERDACVEVMIARDEDGDGHFARPCGEDCDDTDPEVFPGARELCNCVDDDCDGEVDEDLVRECESAGQIGERRCLDCEWTECLLCTVCIPGAVRYCDTPSYCSWGEQRCNSRGDAWGECYETSPPHSCEGFAYDQECCIRSGSCCQDWMDTDGDGDWDDSVGQCDGIVCPSAP